MTGFIALLKKELKEQLKTHKLLIITVVFFVFGVTTPLLLKYMPEIMKLAGEDILINYPVPTALQALEEYTGTIAQVGVLVVVMITMGAIAQERGRGTAAMTLSKPVAWGAFIFAKMVAIAISSAIAIAIASIICYIYTVLLLGEVNISAFIFLNLLLVLFLMLCISVTLLFSSIFTSQLAAGGVALVVLIGQALLVQIPWVGSYLPGKLINWGTELLAGGNSNSWGAMGMSLVIIIVCLFLARVILQRKEI
ncbi:MAG: ABC transporter permease subunit [Dehalococcoidales bacterium]|nr:ABC transporter permease subunit [Dehalococcoidales bacterium]